MNLCNEISRRFNSEQNHYYYLPKQMNNNNNKIVVQMSGVSFKM